MNYVSMLKSEKLLTQLKLFFALSRTPHGLVDMATPVFAALVWLGKFPPLGVSLLGLLTVFAGYSAIYALNDLVDYKPDQIKVKHGVFAHSEGDLDAVLVRHPMAQGLLSYKSGFLWGGAWAAIAVIGAYALNPVCLYIFLVAAGCEAVYCLLWDVSPARTLVSGAVKTSGAIAAIYAVDPSPSFLFVSVLFLFLFFWEIGGQNVPNDWADMEVDAKFNGKTIPVMLGENLSAYIVLNCIITAIFLSLFVFYTSQVHFGFLYVALLLGLGGYLLLWPAVRLQKTQSSSDAMGLFNKSSYYPVGLLGIVALRLILG